MKNAPEGIVRSVLFVFPSFLKKKPPTPGVPVAMADRGTASRSNKRGLVSGEKKKEKKTSKKGRQNKYLREIKIIRLSTLTLRGSDRVRESRVFGIRISHAYAYQKGDRGLFFFVLYENRLSKSYVAIISDDLQNPFVLVYKMYTRNFSFEDECSLRGSSPSIRNVDYSP